MADSIRILHVDDEPDFGDMVATFLEREDDRFSVETATTASEGLSHLSRTEVDCIVSDYDMPGQTGIEFLETVREDHENLPFLLYTGKGSEEIASEAISSGVTDYLQKESGTGQYTVLANRIGNAVDQYRSRKALERNQNRLSLFIDQSPLGVIEWDDEFRFARVNEAAEEILGYTESELVGESWGAVVPQSAQAEVSNVVTQLTEAKGGYTSVNENVRKDGKEIVCEWHNRVITDEDGEVVSVFSQFQDITERQERQERLHKNERRYQAVFNDPNILVGLIDIDGSVLDINRTAMDYIDTSIAELRGRPFWKAPWFTHSDSLQTEVERWVDRAAQGKYVEFDATLSGRNDETYPVQGVFRPVRDDDGDVVSILVSDRDISLQKQRERELEQTNAVLTTLIETLPVGVIAEDESRAIQAVNQRFFELFDITDKPADVVGAGCDGLAEDAAEKFADPAEFVERTADIVAQRDSVRNEQLTLGDGRTFERSYEPMDLPDGQGHLWVYRDSTARLARKRDLETMKRRLEAILDNTTTPMFMKDDGGRYVFVNRGYRELFDLEDQDIVGRTDHEIHPPEMAEAVQKNDQQVIQRADPIETEESITVDGDQRTFLSTKVPIYDTGDRADPTDPVAVFGVATDITDSKIREQQLQALNESMKRLLTADSKREIAELGVEAARDVLDLEASAIHLYDDDDNTLDPVATTDEVEELIGQPAKFTPGSSIAWRVFEDGEPLALDNVHDDPDTYNPESPIHSEIILPIGEYGLLMAGSPTPQAFDQHDLDLGELLSGNIEAAIDQLERTQLLQSRERELAQQNERLDEFASVVSHDLRNPLSVADGHLELAREECSSQHLESVSQAHQRMDTLIDDLLRLAREGDQVSVLEAVDLAAVAQQCWQTVATAEATVQLESEETIRADRSRLQQLLENLYRNAIEHGGSDVTVTIGTIDDGFYVADDGPGIPAGEREQVFQAGHSQTEDGTGFGLSIVKKVADAHDWDVTVTASSDGGARFELTNVHVSS